MLSTPTTGGMSGGKAGDDIYATTSPNSLDSPETVEEEDLKRLEEIARSVVTRFLEFAGDRDPETDPDPFRAFNQLPARDRGPRRGASHPRWG